jgi:hypothetical protein
MQETSLTKAIDRFKNNWTGYISKYRIWLIVTLIAAIADMVSTCRFMLVEGAETEAHPGVRLICMVFGPIAGPLAGKICQLVAVLAMTVYFRCYAIYLFIPVIILYSWAAWYNIWGSQLYYPRLLWLLEQIGA